VTDHDGKGIDVELTRMDLIYDGFNRVFRYNFRVKRYDGSWSSKMDREVFKRLDAVAVLPYDPVRDRIVLIEQFRVGAFAAGEPYRQLEPVAGLMDSHESIEEIARRETLEECGCEVLSLTPMLRYLVSPGCATETVHCFLGTIDSYNVGGLHGCADEGEDIRVHVLDVDDAFRELRANRHTFGLTVICLQWLQLNIDRLRRAALDDAG
jgi:ADP-ribose pyrophosphatase